MEGDPRTWIEVLSGSHKRLAALAERLDSEAVRAPSYASDWTIAQVFSHLGSGAQILLLRLESGLTKSETPELARLQQVWDIWNAKPPDAQVADALTADRTSIERLEAVASELVDVRVPILGREGTATELIARRLNEHALHLWDVEVVCDPMAVVASDAVALVIDNLSGTADRAAKLASRSFSARIVTTEPERIFLLASDGKSLRLEHGTADAVGDSEIHISAEAFTRLIYGRLDPAHTPEGVVVEGESLDLEVLREVFPGY